MPEDVGPEMDADRCDKTVLYHLPSCIIINLKSQNVSRNYGREFVIHFKT